MAAKYYAVKKGIAPGIYETWDDCKKMVDGFPGAEYKSFRTKPEAETYLGIEKYEQCTMDLEPAKSDMVDGGEDYAFVDGSFNAVEGVYGFGGFLIAGGERHVLQGYGSEEELASMRNVAGEILGAIAAVKKALELGLTQLTIYYDYAGIEKWATGEWKRNKAGTIAYYEFMQGVQSRIRVDFVKVKGHSGVDGNEEADRLAKEAVGII